MTTLLQAQQELVSEHDSLRVQVLEILQRPMRRAIGLKEIAQELADLYDRYELERCLLALSEQGLVEPAYTDGYTVGLRAKSLRLWQQ